MTTASTYSLLVPCYNAESYLDKFLANIAKLSIPFDEILFYDDASTDDTVRLILAKGYTLIQGKSNKGPGYARNRLAHAATGDYIHFHDVDDEIAPEFLSLVKQKAELSVPDVIVGYADWIDSATRQPLISWRYDEDQIATDPLAYFIENPLGVINTTYKKDAFLNVSGFDEKQHCWEDADLHIRLARSGAKFVVINQVIAWSIRHNNGISSNQKNCWLCRLNYLDSYKPGLNQKQLLALGQQYEKAANALLHYNKFTAAKFALKQSRQCGYNAPTLNNPFFKAVKSISPTMAFLLKGAIVNFIKK
ncbi:glycosyltransferase family 2 protein [Inquilinus sp. KBS0705]|nr:glycosyltransferase family 2 protein [Inquilinus sp. KBS0705]